MQTLIVNLFGGPGLGKTTTASHLFSQINKTSITCERTEEFARELTQRKDFKTLSNQVFVTGTQYYKEWLSYGTVDLVVTDSPILLGCIYYKDRNDGIYEHYKNLMLALFNKNKTLNFLIERSTNYEMIGRTQTEAEAIEKDLEIKNFLIDNNISFNTVALGDEDSMIGIIKEVLKA